MPVKYDKDFFIFQNKTFKNWSRLNDAGLMLLKVLTDMFQDEVKKADFYNNVSDIVVTSQDRTKRNSNHRNGQAIDITVYPLGLNLWLFKELREYKQTVYVSSFNRHIHFDLREEGLSGVEVLTQNGRDFFPKSSIDASDYSIRIEAPERIQNYLYKWYEAYKLSNLKADIWTSINSPFTGTKKLIQNTQFEAEKWYKENIEPGLDKFLIFGGVVLAYLLLKDSGGKTIVIHKER